MADNPVTDTEPAADVLMRRMLNLMTRLNAVCTDDAAELSRLSEKRQADIAAAEKSARARTERATAGAYELAASKSIGSRLRAELCQQTSVEAQHVDVGPPPLLSATLAEDALGS